MNILLGTKYSSPIGLGLKQVAKNWANFLKLHLKYPLIDGLALLRGNHAFVMELEDGERVIGKVEKIFELVTKVRTSNSTSRATHSGSIPWQASSTH